MPRTGGQLRSSAGGCRGPPWWSAPRRCVCTRRTSRALSPWPAAAAFATRGASARWWSELRHRPGRARAAAKGREGGSRGRRRRWPAAGRRLDTGGEEELVAPPHHQRRHAAPAARRLAARPTCRSPRRTRDAPADAGAAKAQRDAAAQQRAQHVRNVGKSCARHTTMEDGRAPRRSAGDRRVRACSRLRTEHAKDGRAAAHVRRRRRAQQPAGVRRRELQRDEARADSGSVIGGDPLQQLGNNVVNELVVVERRSGGAARRHYDVHAGAPRQLAQRPRIAAGGGAIANAARRRAQRHTQRVELRLDRRRLWPQICEGAKVVLPQF